MSIKSNKKNDNDIFNKKEAQNIFTKQIISNRTNSTQNNELNISKTFKYNPPHIRSQIPFETETNYITQKNSNKMNRNINRSVDDIQYETHDHNETNFSNVKSDKFQKFSMIEKLRQRENLSKLVSSKLDSAGKSEKEIFQENFENQQFSLNRGLMEDKMRRAKINNKIKENIQKQHLYKYVKQENPEVSNYYKNYVENTNIKSGIYKLGIKNEKSKVLYAQELISQSKAKKEQDSITKAKEYNEFMHSVLFNKKKFDNNEKEREEKKLKMKEEFLMLNGSIIQDKRRREEKKKKNDIYKDREWLAKIDHDLVSEREMSHNYRNEMKNNYKNTLKSQINEKVNIRTQSLKPL